MDNLHLKALVHSYWYYTSEILPKATSEPDRTNIVNLIERLVTRIQQETDKD